MQPEETKEQFIKRTVAKRKGKFIRVVGWTEENGSGSVSHHKSVTSAINQLRRVARYHPNFAVECYSENPPDSAEPPLDFIHRRKREHNDCPDRTSR